LEARGKRYMMMNVPKGTLEKVKEIVPGLDGPTVLDLYGNTDVVAVHVVIEASKLNDVIPLLRDLGVHGILVSHIERLMP
ncbi:MAG TPA: ATP phosphoribosyltransferase, partial [Acidimicrobiia bacterium]|nr:ATP phosphoribosyltransferase [Acidimicrobiia bacterium]